MVRVVNLAHFLLNYLTCAIPSSPFLPGPLPRAASSSGHLPGGFLQPSRCHLRGALRAVPSLWTWAASWEGSSEGSGK